MRKHFQPGGYVPTGLAVEELSVEEEAIASQEIDEHQAQADETATQVQHLADVQTAMDDTVLVVDMIPEVGQTDGQLLGVVADMVTAGDVADPMEILPITPKGDGELVAVSTEGIVETVKDIWKRIVEFITKMWKHVTDFFVNTFGYLERLKKRIASLRERCKKLGSQTPTSQDRITVISWSGAFNVDGKLVDVNKLDAEIVKLHTLIGSLYKHAPNAALNIGKLIEDAFKRFDPTTVPKGLGYNGGAAAASTESIGSDVPVKVLTDFAGRLSEAFGKYTHCFSDVSKETNTKDGVLITTGPLLGSFHIEVTIPAATNDLANQPLDLFSALAKIKPQVKKDHEGPAQPGGFSYPLMATSGYDSQLGEIEKIIDLMLEFKKGGVHTKLQAQNEAINKAAASVIAKLKDENQKAAANMVRRMLPLSAAYANWSKEPMTGAISHCTKTFVALLSMIENGVAYYEKKSGKADKGAKEGAPAAA